MIRTTILTAILFCFAATAYAETTPWRPEPVTLDKQRATIQKRKPSAPLPVMGWIEWARLPDVDEDTKAKLDTGAKTSSLNANVIKTFKRGGKEYALFRIDLNRKYEEGDKAIEREITRWVKIKKKEGGLLRRPVVQMSFCIGDTVMNGEVSLAKRDHFNYNILVGRNMLSQVFVVDASRIFTTKPRCK